MLYWRCRYTGGHEIAHNKKWTVFYNKDVESSQRVSGVRMDKKKVLSERTSQKEGVFWGRKRILKLVRDERGGWESVRGKEKIN